MTRVALVGAAGYVGRAIGRALARRAGVELTAVTRADYAERRAAEYDVVINSAMPSGRYAAKVRPLNDFRETVQKTADLVYGWRARKFVQISSLSARCQPDTVYGRHKAAAEALLDAGAHLVVRLGPMFSADLKKGVLIDLLHDRDVFVGAESAYGFAHVDFVGRWVAENLGRTGVVEVAARDALPLAEVARFLGSRSRFVGPVDVQRAADPGADFPPASDLFAFLAEAGGELRRATA